MNFIIELTNGDEHAEKYDQSGEERNMTVAKRLTPPGCKIMLNFQIFNKRLSIHCIAKIKGTSSRIVYGMRLRVELCKTGKRECSLNDFRT